MPILVTALPHSAVLYAAPLSHHSYVQRRSHLPAALMDGVVMLEESTWKRIGHRSYRPTKVAAGRP